MGINGGSLISGTKGSIDETWKVHWLFVQIAEDTLLYLFSLSPYFCLFFWTSLLPTSSLKQIGLFYLGFYNSSILLFRPLVTSHIKERRGTLERSCWTDQFHHCSSSPLSKLTVPKKYSVLGEINPLLHRFVFILLCVYLSGFLYLTIWKDD